MNKTFNLFSRYLIILILGINNLHIINSILTPLTIRIT